MMALELSRERGLLERGEVKRVAGMRSWALRTRDAGDSRKGEEAPLPAGGARGWGSRDRYPDMQRSARTTLTWIQQLGFESFIAEVDDSNQEFKQSQKVRCVFTYNGRDIVSTIDCSTTLG